MPYDRECLSTLANLKFSLLCLLLQYHVGVMLRQILVKVKAYRNLTSGFQDNQVIDREY